MTEIKEIGRNERVAPIEKTSKPGERRPDFQENPGKKGQRKTPPAGPNELHLGNNIDVRR